MAEARLKLGRIVFHGSDDSEFVAKKAEGSKPRTEK
jgi:hypothetical protein